jgi:hypothetical protein
MTDDDVRQERDVLRGLVAKLCNGGSVWRTDQGQPVVFTAGVLVELSDAEAHAIDRLTEHTHEPAPGPGETRARLDAYAERPAPGLAGPGHGTDPPRVAGDHC